MPDRLNNKTVTYSVSKWIFSAVSIKNAVEPLTDIKVSLIEIKDEDDIKVLATLDQTALKNSCRVISETIRKGKLRTNGVINTIIPRKRVFTISTKHCILWVHFKELENLNPLIRFIKRGSIVTISSRHIQEHELQQPNLSADSSIASSFDTEYYLYQEEQNKDFTSNLQRIVASLTRSTRVGSTIGPTQMFNDNDGFSNSTTRDGSSNHSISNMVNRNSTIKPEDLNRNTNVNNMTYNSSLINNRADTIRRQLKTLMQRQQLDAELDRIIGILDEDREKFF